MLFRLLRVQLRPYGKEITLVVLFQFVQTLATLYLPTLNADIIDDGVVKGDTGTILRVGLVMLGVTLIQITCSIHHAIQQRPPVRRSVRARRSRKDAWTSSYLWLCMPSRR